MRLSKLLTPFFALALAGCGGEELPDRPVLFTDRVALNFNQDFGRGTYVGQTTFDSLYVENRGLQPLEITKVEKSGADSSRFTLTLPPPLDSNQPLRLEARQAAAIQVAFRPDSQQSQVERLYEAVLTVTSNDPEQGTLQVPLSGKGFKP